MMPIKMLKEFDDMYNRLDIYINAQQVSQFKY